MYQEAIGFSTVTSLLGILLKLLTSFSKTLINGKMSYALAYFSI